MFKASSSISKFVATSIFQFGLDQNTARPLTYFEAHQDDHEIANYIEDNERGREEILQSEEEGSLKNNRRVDEGEVLDWQETESGENAIKGEDIQEKDSLVTRSSSIIPLTSVKYSQEPRQDEDEVQESDDSS